MIKNPLISVVIPVYNVERYLAAALDSIAGQDIGFLQNVEVILVNDGSSDGSSKICREYRENYPENVLYIQQSNQGVSAARNKGLLKARGKYINFFDGDDIWSKDAFRHAVEFLGAHKESVDFVAFKIKFFDKDISEHPANYKFSNTRIIDVEKEPDNPIFHLPTCFFVASVTKDKKFDTQLTMTEDAKFLSEVLVEKKAYGVSAESAYNYRKRQDNSSAIGGQLNSRDYYLTVPKRAYNHMLDVWRDELGNAHKYIQYALLGDMAWRLRQSNQSVLTDKEQGQYKQAIFDIIKQCDDEAIVSKRGMSTQLKVFMLKIKHGEDGFLKNITFDKQGYRYAGHRLFGVNEEVKLYIDFLQQTKEGDFLIEGNVTGDAISDMSDYQITTSQGKYQLEPSERADCSENFLDEEVYNGGGFKARIKLAKSIEADAIKVRFYKDDVVIEVPIEVNQFSGFSRIPRSYVRIGNRLLLKNNKIISSFSYTKRRHCYFELRFIARIALSLRLRIAVEQWRKVNKRNLTLIPIKARLFEVSKPLLIIGDAVWMIPRSIATRLMYRVAVARKSRPVWLISDRGMSAGDNGEALFRYIQSRDDCRADVYFVLSKKSKDYQRMQQYGRAVNQDSFRYKLLFILADKVISSQADIEVTNPFFRQMDHIVDLYSFDFIFLQHGIIRHDLSGWLNRYNKNIRLFVTSAEVEYRSILEHDYYYDKDVVKLTGLPRYDYLNSKPKGKLILAPTYRKSLVKKPTNKNGFRPYDDMFKQSEYFRFYNSLIKDGRICQALVDNDMIGELYLHPGIAAQTVDFSENNNFRVKDFPYDYRTAFEEGSIMVTDYSSVVFDFAYLKKPVIYAHFDADKFYNEQAYDKSYFFSDEKDGFGPVVHSYEELVDQIIKTIDGGCNMSEKYKKRVDAFFYKKDRNNSRRVYDAIMKVDED